MLERTYVQDRQVARTLGIKTGTLAKWRRQGRGPKGWVRLGRTSVVVERILVPFFGDYRTEKIKAALVRNFVAFLRSRSCAAFTINRTMSVS